MQGKYLWQNDLFPHFTWDAAQLIKQLSEVRNLQGQLLGRMMTLGFDGLSRQVEVITDEIVGSSQIEGVMLNADSVRSSVAHWLGVDLGDTYTTDHYTEGVVQVTMDAIRNADKQLDAERMFDWHAALFPTGRSGFFRITVAAWREGETPMQVVSGPLGKEKVHYEAPPSTDVPHLMEQFITWFNTDSSTDPLLKAAIAHLWFVTIHPFDDGNGRITRTITEMLLMRSDGNSGRFYSLSAEIMRQRKSYYDALQHAQQATMDITAWLQWFLSTLHNAIQRALDTTDRTLSKAVFWSKHQDKEINERQRKVINRLWDGFEGKLNTQKYAKICHCSQDTALQDIQWLINAGIFRRADEGGRSTNYELIE